MRTYGTSETFNVTPSRIVNIIMLNMLVGMKDSNVKYVINDLAASQDKKKYGSSLMIKTIAQYTKDHSIFAAKKTKIWMEAVKSDSEATVSAFLPLLPNPPLGSL